MSNICLFPLPDSVTFPGTVFPLHVFEPRYRNMMKYCLENDIEIAVCHTKKVISPAKNNQTIEQVLQTNQATYKPYEIFSAGQCELLETADDGRMYLNIHMNNRYKSIREVQTLPFLIHECEPYNDRDETQEELDHAAELKKILLARLIELTKDNPDVQAALASEEWQQKQVKKFSFELFSLIAFEPEIQQEILSLNSSIERLQFTLDLLLNINDR